MKIKEGQYWYDDYDEDIIKITRYIKEDGSIEFEVVEDRKKAWKESKQSRMSTGALLRNYKLLQGYETPLWKVLNEDSDR